ncbi:bisanhydrobacterioruberin hydratase [Halalkalicoccus paucihalophilus]|uniref:bisanhydrobacterioruberin hydratase n=1 Tax=Halalkalicoccus paucihalophilus TaxID=1008153 RepID=UPI001FE0FE5C|nr:bisanhydrobacterioruberin hydratase [Halalkalicoccus paucihalophilus]
MSETAVATQRARVESTLERVVEENRFTIAVTFPLVGVAMLLAGRAELIPAELAMNPYLLIGANLVMVSPLVAGLVPLIDRRAAIGLSVLALFTWGIELAGVLTGLPYGEFSYGVELGPMLFDLVPLGLPVFYFPILLNSYLLALLFLGTPSLLRRFVLTLGIVLALDLILDPGAVALGFWGWEVPGGYYGVPAINYLGWALSGSVAIAILQFSFDHEAVLARLERCGFFLDDLVSFLVLWGLINASVGNWIPVALSLSLLVTLLASDWFDFNVLGT